jgi:hypothetical protein
MIKTVGDLRRALEGVTDETPLVMVATDAFYCHYNEAPSSIALELDDQGTAKAFVIRGDTEDA